MSFTSHAKAGLALHRRQLGDYVDDLETALAQIPEPPILVAHSLGGLVALHLLARRQGHGAPLPGAILLSAIPPDGVWRSLVHLARQDALSPLKLLALAFYPPVRFWGKPPKGIYSEAPDATRARTVTAQLRAESIRTLVTTLARRPVAAVATPLYCIGMTGDHIIPASEVRRSAALLKADCRIFEGYSHTPMAERGWQHIAEAMVDWMGMRSSSPATATRREGGYE